MRRLGARGTALPGIVALCCFALMAVLADWIAPYDPWQRFDPYLRPQRAHLLGTNDIGNDILSEVIHGARVSLLVGMGAGCIATLLGVVIGLPAGYFRGFTDEVLMGLTDVFLMMPRIPLIILLAAFVKPGYWIIIVVLGLLGWTTTARVVRSKALQLRQAAFVSGARTLGFSSLHVMFSDILPNIVHVLAPKFMLTVASAMISEASLSFLGLGDPTRKSWGMIIRFAFTRGGFINDLWWWYAAPGAAMVLCVLSIVVIGFSLETAGAASTGGGYAPGLPVRVPRTEGE